MAPLQIKQNILAGIDGQIARARRGEPSGVFIKTNSITDKDVILKIVEASQAGVECTLLVRGISCIVPGVEGYTDNVRVVSIVGRLLGAQPHLRLRNARDCKIYLSSADLMTRNMDKRIEIAWPVLNKELHDQIVAYLDTCMADTAKLRELFAERPLHALGHFAKKDDQGRARFVRLPKRAHRRALRRHHGRPSPTLSAKRTAAGSPTSSTKRSSQAPWRAAIREQTAPPPQPRRKRPQLSSARCPKPTCARTRDRSRTCARTRDRSRTCAPTRRNAEQAPTRETSTREPSEACGVDGEDRGGTWP